MKPNKERWMLSIDGGGTKTEVCIARDTNGQVEIVARVHGGPANLTVQPVGDVIFKLDGLIRSAICASGSSIDGFQHAIIGLAGGGDAKKCQRVSNWIESKFSAMSSVCSDAEIILMIAEQLTEKTKGAIALLVGTGAVAFFKDSNSNKIDRVGGWGPMLGDDGSGFWIGRQAIRHVLKESDAGKGPSRLTTGLLQNLEADTTRDLISKVYGARNSAQTIAGLTTVVLEAASNEDADANEILNAATAHVVAMANQAIRRMRCQPSQVVVACAGGLLSNTSAFSTKIEQSIRSQNVKHVHVVDDPAVAAFQLFERP